MLKTKSITKSIFSALAVMLFVVIPTSAHAGPTGDYGSGSWDYDTSSDWGGYTPSYSYDYSPSYGNTSSDWGGYTPSYSYDYSPSYNSGYNDNYDYSGSSSYQPYSYSGSTGGGYSYTPSYSYGGGYPTHSYTGSSIGGASTPANSNSTSGSNSSNTTHVNTNSNASAVASSTNINNNINNNNVYVYANPQGTAVLQNPAFQHLDGYCTITPNNPRVGQTVTVTAYATGGIGSYQYTWGGDLTYGSGASTQFTSQTTGTKNIAVTVRSGEEVVTRNCTVTFVNEVNNYTGSSVSVSRVSSGNPVSGVFVQPGTPVSGVYLNQLPATGFNLTWIHYLVAFFTLILGSVAFTISRSRKQLLAGINE